VRAYSVEKSGKVHVKWKIFVGDVNKVFNADALERTPLTKPPPNPPDVARFKSELTGAEEAAVEAVLSRLRHHCRVRRVLVKPFFADAEYNRNSMRVVDHITRAQYEQCLSRLNFELNGDELLLLQKKFDDHNDGFVNYVAFACAVDMQEHSGNRDEPRADSAMLDCFKTNANFNTEKIAALQPGRPPMTSDPSRPPAGLETLIMRLQDKALQFNIPVQDFFVDYDKHKLGAISKSQFRRGLNYAFGDAYIRETISEVELNSLEDLYKREMIDGAHYVDWRSFCKKINEALLVSNLEVKPFTQPERRVIEPQPVTLGAVEEMRIAKLLAAIGERFRIRSVYAKAPFHDFAKSFNSPMMVDHITRQQFVQGLSRLGIELPYGDLEVLFQKYDDNADGSVNYVAFSRDVDATETFSDRVTPVEKGTFYGGFRNSKVHEHLVRSL